MPAIDRLFLEICKLYCQTKDSAKSCRNRENTALNLRSEPRAQVSEWCFQLYITLRYVPRNSEVTWSKLTLFCLIQSVSSYVIFLIFFHSWYLSCPKKKDLQGHVDAVSPMALHVPVYLLLPSQKVLCAAQPPHLHPSGFCLPSARHVPFVCNKSLLTASTASRKMVFKHKMMTWLLVHTNQWLLADS